MNYYSGIAQFCYRTTFLAASITYGIVVYKTFKARAKTGQKMPNGILGLISDENIQYLGKQKEKKKEGGNRSYDKLSSSY